MKVAKIGTLIFAVLLCACSNEPAPDAASGAEPSETAVPNAPPRASGAAIVADRRSAAPAPAVPVPAVPKTTEVPAGTAIKVTMIDAISTEKNQIGDSFLARLSEALVIDGKTVAEPGTKVQGRIVDAVGAGRVKGVASMRIVLTSIMDGEKAIPIVTEPLVSEAAATKGRDAAIVGGAAGIGAAIGAIAGGKKGAGIGAIVGGGSGTGAVLATKGNEVEYGSESKLTFMLQKTAKLPTITKETS